MLAQKAWQNYEEVAQFLLDQLASHFRLGRVEGKQVVAGVGTTWEIDAKGVREDGKGFVVIECKRHTKQGVPQAVIGALVCSVRDTGAVGGIIVSPLPLQNGARNLATSRGIQEVTLHENSTTTDYILEFLNKIFVGLSDGAVMCDKPEAEIIRSADRN
jgi:Restriction endonuclease